MAKLKTSTARGTHLEQLKTLAAILATAIDGCEDVKTLPQLAKQYRETIQEIKELEGAETSDDEIGEILAKRQADGKPGAVRKNRASVQEQ